MTINVLRSTNERGENEMMKLVRYDAESVYAAQTIVEVEYGEKEAATEDGGDEWTEGDNEEQVEDTPSNQNFNFPSMVVEDDEEVAEDNDLL